MRPPSTIMRNHDGLQAVLPWLAVVCAGLYCLALQVKDSFGSINVHYIVDGLLPWVIGCNVFLNLVLEIFYLPTFDGLRWLASIPIYFWTAFDVLVCYVSLIRINFSYLWLAIFPLIAISFIWVMCMRHNKKERISRTGTDNGKKAAQIPEKFNIVALVSRLTPHLILSVFGMLGDPDHDGNNYDIANFFLFLTCMLQDLTRIRMRLPSISRGIAPASEFLYKASLVVLLLTAHMMVVNAFGEKVVLLLVPEVLPPLLWLSVHLDRRTSIISIQNIKDCVNSVYMPVLAVMFGCIVAFPKNESVFFGLYWASMSCTTSGVMTYIIVLVLLLWPEKSGMATLSFREAKDLLMFWGKVLLESAAGLFGLLFLSGGLPKVYLLST